MEHPTDNPEERKRADGARWLAMLGEEDLIGTTVTLPDGRRIKAEEFTLIYDEDKYKQRVLPFFVRLENMSDDDPERPAYVEALRGMLHVYIGNSPEG